MACGCGKRQRAAAAGKTIVGYRVTLSEEHPTNPKGVIPPATKPPFMSAAEARTAIRENGGGSAFTVYSS